MEIVAISSKYRIVIPRRVRDALGLKPGQRLCVIQREKRIELVPVTPVNDARGFLAGIDTDVERSAPRLNALDN